MSKSIKTYKDGYAVGEDSEGNGWAWGRKTVGAGKNKLTVYDAQKLVYPTPYSQPIIYVADQFLTKQEAINFCKTHCVKLYPGPIGDTHEHPYRPIPDRPRTERPYRLQPRQTERTGD